MQRWIWNGPLWLVQLHDPMSCVIMSCPEVPEEQPAVIKLQGFSGINPWNLNLWTELSRFLSLRFKSCFWFSIQSVWLRTWLPVIDFALENTQRLRTGCWQRRSACGKGIILPSASAPYATCAYVSVVCFSVWCVFLCVFCAAPQWLKGRRGWPCWGFVVTLTNRSQDCGFEWAANHQISHTDGERNAEADGK